jgi:hypothetical protein
MLNPKVAYKIALMFNKPMPQYEYILARSSRYAFLYAKNVINGSFPLGEKAIARSCSNSFEYARYIINKRFTLGEKAILKNTTFTDASEILRRFNGCRCKLA